MSLLADIVSNTLLTLCQNPKLHLREDSTMRNRVFLFLFSVLLIVIPQSHAQAQLQGMPLLVRGKDGQTLTASKTKNLSAKGNWITVSGNSYDERVGIYITMCIKPKAGKIPTPCGGGVNKTGTSASSVWVSSNPPAYGVGTAKPFGIGGAFKVRLFVGPRIGKFDCRKTKCVIVTRADHLQTSNRSADLFIPVTFVR